MTITVSSAQKGTTEVPRRRLFSPHVLDYFRRHAIDPRLAVAAGVRERNGLLIFAYRAPDGTRFERIRDVRAPGLAKVKQPKGVPLCLYWPFGRPRDPLAVVACEGESDALAAGTALFHGSNVDLRRDVVVAGCPGTGFPAVRLTDELVAVDASEVILAFDADRAGRQYTQAAAKSLAAAGLMASVVALPDSLDIAAWLARVDDPTSFTAALVAAEAW